MEQTNTLSKVTVTPDIRHYRVAPFRVVKENGKKKKYPCFKEWNGEDDWQVYATNDMNVVMQWLTKYPDCVLQAVLENGDFALEADMHADEFGDIVKGGGLRFFEQWDSEFGYAPTLAIETPTNGGQRRFYSGTTGTMSGLTRMVTPRNYPQIQVLRKGAIIWGKGYKTIDPSPIAYRPEYLYGIIEVPVVTISDNKFDKTPEQELKEAAELSKRLSYQRMYDRESWIDYLMVMYGLQDKEGARKIAKETSKIARSKYDEWYFENTWDTLPDPYSIGFGSLVFWAEEDDPQPIQMSAPIGDNKTVEVPKIKSISSVSDEKLKEFTKLGKGSLTDWGNAMRLIERYGSVLRWNKSFNWIIWDGKQWKIDSPHSHKYAQDTARSIYVEASKITGDKDLSDAWSKWANQSLGSYHLSKMLEEAQTHLYADVDDFSDNNHWLLNVENGVLDLKTYELLPHDPKYYMTKIAGTHFDAVSTCPKWDAFIEMIFPDLEVRRYMRKAVGYSFTGNSDMKAMFFLWGESGNNGKSTFIKTIMNALGEYAKLTDIDALLNAQRGGLTPLNEDFLNRRFVCTNEIPKGTRWGTNKVKSLTGNDRIPVNPKHRAPYDFEPSHTLWVFGNNKPQSDGDDEAFWNRVKLIAFDNPIPDEVQRPMEEVLAEFNAELSGILNWCLAGLQDYLKEGISEPERVKRDTVAYQMENDFFTQFIEDECELDVEAVVDKRRLYSRYEEYARNNNEHPTPTSFTQKLKKIGVNLYGDSKKSYKGIKLTGIASQSFSTKPIPKH